MFMVELLYFYLSLYPGIKKKINNQLGNVQNQMAVHYCKMREEKDISEIPVTNIDVHLSGGLTMLDERNKKLMNRHNDYVMLTGICIFFLMVISIYTIRLKLKKPNGPPCSLKSAHLSSFITIICILLFQYKFIEFGKIYKYAGTDEYNKIIVDYIHKHKMDKDTNIYYKTITANDILLPSIIPSNISSISIPVMTSNNAPANNLLNNDVVGGDSTSSVNGVVSEDVGDVDSGINLDSNIM